MSENKSVGCSLKSTLFNSGKILKRYKEEWIVKITDITDFVVETRESILTNRFERSMLPVEKEYPLKK